jgi:toxin-antitoxin system PIN domain toxin
VIVVDANLLIYSYDTASPNYAASRSWIEKIFSGSEVVGLPGQSLAAFLRVLTNRQLPRFYVKADEAAEIVDEWLRQPNVRVLTPGEEHWVIFRRMIVEGAAAGPRVTDAQLAALTIEHGGVLYTADRDFARFPGLRWKNPLS